MMTDFAALPGTFDFADAQLSACGRHLGTAGGQPHEKLSDHELKTLVMITSDDRLSNIAANPVLSPKTMSVYRSCVLEKLQLANNSELTVYAIRN